MIMNFVWNLQKQQLLKLNVPATFMTVALEEGPGPPIKYQYAELGKLYAVVSQLVRCCDVANRCQSSVQVGAGMDQEKPNLVEGPVGATSIIRGGEG